MDWRDDEVLRIRSKDLTWREVDGEIIALDLVTSLYFTTNQTGAQLWMLLVDGVAFGEMSAWLVASYSLSAADAESDTRAFLELLRSHSLLDGR